MNTLIWPDTDAVTGIRWLASVPASPPAEPDAPEPPVKSPDKPANPDLPPEEEVPPEIDDPPPDVIPEPIREPPVMPPPTAVTEIRVDPYWRHRPMADRDPLGIARRLHGARGGETSTAMHAACRHYANGELDQMHAAVCRTGLTADSATSDSFPWRLIVRWNWV